MTELSRISDLKSDRAEAAGAARGLEQRIQDLQQTVRDVIAAATRVAPPGQPTLVRTATGHVSVTMPQRPTLADIAHINAQVVQILPPADLARARDAEDAAQRSLARLRHLRGRATQLDQLITECERKYGTQP